VQHRTEMPHNPAYRCGFIHSGSRITWLEGEGAAWWTGIHYSVINRLAPEVATDLP